MLTSELQVKLVGTHTVPAKADTLFRYDPPVLIVYVRWHKTDQSFRKILWDSLYLSYVGNERLVGKPAIHPELSETLTCPHRSRLWSDPLMVP